VAKAQVTFMRLAARDGAPGEVPVPGAVALGVSGAGVNENSRKDTNGFRQFALFAPSVLRTKQRKTEHQAQVCSEPWHAKAVGAVVKHLKLGSWGA
jgi:hypothetical protein